MTLIGISKSLECMYNNRVLLFPLRFTADPHAVGREKDDFDDFEDA